MKTNKLNAQDLIPVSDTRVHSLDYRVSFRTGADRQIPVRYLSGLTYDRIFSANSGVVTKYLPLVQTTGQGAFSKEYSRISCTSTFPSLTGSIGVLRFKKLSYLQRNLNGISGIIIRNSSTVTSGDKVFTEEELVTVKKFTGLPIASLNRSQLLLLQESKALYFLYEYNSRFPGRQIWDYDRVNKLLNISNEGRKIAREITEAFALFNEVPTWAFGDSQVWEVFSKGFSQHARDLKLELEKLKAQEDELRKKLDAEILRIGKLRETVQDKYIRINPYLMINKITQESLPLDIVQELSACEEPTKVELQEALDSYKLELAKGVSSGALTVDQLIEILK